MKLIIDNQEKNIVKIHKRELKLNGGDDGISDAIKSIIVLTEGGMLYGFDSEEELSSHTTSASVVESCDDSLIFHRLDSVVVQYHLEQNGPFILKAREYEDYTKVAIITENNDCLFLKVTSISDITNCTLSNEIFYNEEKEELT